MSLTRNILVILLGLGRDWMFFRGIGTAMDCLWILTLAWTLASGSLFSVKAPYYVSVNS